MANSLKVLTMNKEEKKVQEKVNKKKSKGTPKSNKKDDAQFELENI